MALTLSQYAESLQDGVKQTYKVKLKYINDMDPYLLTEHQLDTSLNAIPHLSHANITEFLIFRVSPVTHREIKAYKSLEAFIQFACKWVQCILAKKINDNYLIVGKVRHSQKVSAPPLKSWIIIAHTGEILASHCNCVAGLGEACTHVAAVLCGLEYANRCSSEEKSVTDILAYWTGPSRKGEFYKKIADIDFSAPTKIMKQEESESSSNSEEEGHSEEKDLTELTSTERKAFLLKFKAEGQQSVLFEIDKDLCEEGDDENLPKPLTDLYDKKNKNLSLIEVQQLVKTLNITISAQEAAVINEKTIKQCESILWFKMRTGRITASKFKAVCQTKLENPSLSLVKQICYPSMFKRYFRATEYGCKHEKNALQHYLKQHREEHTTAKVNKCGFTINPKYPYFGASPDGILACDICGEVCIEVKCPFCMRDLPVEDMIYLKNSYLKDKHGTISLDKNHSYYYQIQMQLAVTEKNFCDFVVWSSKSLFVERFVLDQVFWEEKSKYAKNFFYEVLLPELLSKCYTEKTPTTSSNGASKNI